MIAMTVAMRTARLRDDVIKSNRTKIAPPSLAAEAPKIVSKFAFKNKPRHNEKTKSFTKLFANSNSPPRPNLFLAFFDTEML